MSLFNLTALKITGHFSLWTFYWLDVGLDKFWKMENTKKEIQGEG